MFFYSKFVKLMHHEGALHCTSFNPFQSNFSATRILPSSYLFWAGKRLVDYLSVLHEEKRRTGSDSGGGEQTQQKNVSDVFQHWSGTGKS
jgi:hypothetical protein